MHFYDLPAIRLEDAVYDLGFFAPDHAAAVAAMDDWIAATGIDDDSALAERLWDCWAVGATAAGLLPIAAMH